VTKSISKAFTYMFKDSDWKYKIFIATMITIPNTLSIYAGQNFKNMQLFDISKLSKLANLANLSSLSGASNLANVDDYSNMAAAPNPAYVSNMANLSHILILSMVLALIASAATVILIGYFCKCTQNVINCKDDGKPIDLLPSWEKDFGLYTKLGIQFSYGSMLSFALPVILLISIFMSNPHNITTLGIPCFIWILFICFAYAALWAIFCTDFKPSSFLAYRRAMKVIMHNLPNYLAILGTFIGLGALISWLFVLFLHTPTFVVAFSIIQTYFSFVFAYLLGIVFQVHPVKLFR